MIDFDCVPLEQMIDTIWEHDHINECATILRDLLLNEDFDFRINFVMHAN